MYVNGLANARPPQTIPGFIVVGSRLGSPVWWTGYNFAPYRSQAKGFRDPTSAAREIASPYYRPYNAQIVRALIVV